jgi:hypothetical protein
MGTLLCNLPFILIQNPLEIHAAYAKNITSSNYLCVGYMLWPSQKRYAIMCTGIYFHLL